MKDKAPFIVMLIVAVGLSVGLIVVNNKARQEKKDAEASISSLSNTVVSVKSSLAELQSVNQALETNLAAIRAERLEYSNKLALAQANVHSIQADLEKAQSDAKAQTESTAAELAKRDKKISDLESQNQDLDKEATELRAKISDLDTRITATQKKLDSSEGDRALLLTELKQLRDQKEDLERKFNDLAAVRKQLHKLKAELAEARRLDWIRRGLYNFGEKGGQRLIDHTSPPPPDTNVSTKVELRQSGGVKIQEPVPTNSSAK
ncbi:MAG: hypothetical protein ABSG59_03890 [Verrucomicrobiota bacterium]|jgi:chromosome segregation ATPase